MVAEGMNGVRALRAEFPKDSNCGRSQDHGWGLVGEPSYGRAGANLVVVMGQAHRETVELVARAGKDLGVKVMGDNLGMSDMVAGAKLLEDAGCDYVIHHIAYDLRTVLKEQGKPFPSPLDQLRDVVRAVKVPVQAVGGMTIEQAIEIADVRCTFGCHWSAARHRCRRHFAPPEATSKRLCDRFVNAYTPMAMCQLERSIKNGKRRCQGLVRLTRLNMEASSCGRFQCRRSGNRMCC